MIKREITLTLDDSIGLADAVVGVNTDGEDDETDGDTVPFTRRLDD